MRSAGVQGAGDASGLWLGSGLRSLVGRGTVDLFDDIVGDGLAAAAVQHRHLLAITGRAAEV
jgi:hypothetical protein